MQLNTRIYNLPGVSQGWLTDALNSLSFNSVCTRNSAARGAG